MGGQRDGWMDGCQYIYCLPPAGGRIRSQGNYYCLPPAGVLHSQNKVEVPGNWEWEEVPGNWEWAKDGDAKEPV